MWSCFHCRPGGIKVRDEWASELSVDLKIFSLEDGKSEPNPERIYLQFPSKIESVSAYVGIRNLVTRSPNCLCIVHPSAHPVQGFCKTCELLLHMLARPGVNLHRDRLKLMLHSWSTPTTNSIHRARHLVFFSPTTCKIPKGFITPG
jgi:hypothetical protein